MNVKCEILIPPLIPVNDFKFCIHFLKKYSFSSCVLLNMPVQLILCSSSTTSTNLTYSSCSMLLLILSRMRGPAQRPSPRSFISRFLQDAGASPCSRGSPRPRRRLFPREVWSEASSRSLSQGSWRLLFHQGILAAYLLHLALLPCSK